MKEYLVDKLRLIQAKLCFEGWAPNTQFTGDKGLGRVAMQACILGSLWGVHVVLVILLVLYQKKVVVLLPDHKDEIIGEARIQLLCQWCIYVVVLSTFHLLEFFTTAIYNPNATSAESFLINHSLMYTAAVLSSTMEFWTRFLLFPSFQSSYVTIFGLGLVILAQLMRSVGMVTCGESFNHRIQTSKKDNHVLITHGIYAYFRHPAYVGFYYWSIGTQILLNNPIHSVLFAVASTMFFRRRIPFEEESLFQYFPDEYPTYRERTWMGIPFVPTVDLKKQS